MYELTDADKIWNRACEGGGDSPSTGDLAQASLLLFHGLAMNGGVLHAAECLSFNELDLAQEGFRYFSFEPVADTISEARKSILLKQYLDVLEAVFDQQYWAQIPDDGVLAKRFEIHQSVNPDEYSPLVIN